MQTYILKTRLLYGKNISRQIEAVKNTSLYRLAAAIVDSYNFNFDHCFGFFSKVADFDYFNSEKKYELFTDLAEEDPTVEPTGAGSVKKTKISQVWEKIGDKMMFLFDYGDNWQFAVELIGFGEKKPRKKYPRISNKIGKAPKQY